MSRIDEALRRAAGNAVGVEPGTDEWPAPDQADLAELEREPYPLEMPGAAERRPVRPARISSGSAGRENPAAPPPDAVASDEADPAGSSLFDRIDTRLAEKVVIDSQILPASREQYRRLAAVLHDAQGSTGLRVLMVASAVAGEGKTLTAANLALTFSESYQKRVLMIDADLRRPTLHRVFRVQSATGLVDDLANPGSKLVVRQLSPRLSMLPAGRPSSDPMAALTSARMRQLLDEARRTFDWVILDTPPLGLLPDANLLASMMDGVVMVIRAGSTPHEIIRRSVESVGRSRVLGVVLNGAQLRPGNYAYEYYGDSSAGDESLQALSVS